MVLSFARKGYLACVLSMLAIGMSHGQSKLDSIQHLDEVTVTARSFSFKEVIPSQKSIGERITKFEQSHGSGCFTLLLGCPIERLWGRRRYQDSKYPKYGNEPHGCFLRRHRIKQRAKRTSRPWNVFLRQYRGDFFIQWPEERYFPIRKRFRCGRYALSAFSSSSFRRWKNQRISVPR